MGTVQLWLDTNKTVQFDAEDDQQYSRLMARHHQNDEEYMNLQFMRIRNQKQAHLLEMFFNKNICGIGVYSTFVLLMVQIFFLKYKLVLTFLFDFSELPQPSCSPKISGEKRVDPKI